jgi:hypothetical protein
MMKKHLTQNDVTGYIYNSLDDAQREFMDMHLLDCHICRANLSEQEYRQRKISNELSAVLKAASPSAQMNFAAIAPHVRNQNTALKLWPRLTAHAPAALALMGLLFAVFGLWQHFYERTILSLSSQSLGAFPTLACFFLMLASIGQVDRTPINQARFIVTWASALILWLGSILIGLLNLIVIRDLAIMTVIAFGGSPSDAAPIAIISVMIGVIFFIGIIFGSGEFHYRNIGQPASWKLFAITIMGQLLLLIIPYLIW